MEAKEVMCIYFELDDSEGFNIYLCKREKNRTLFTHPNECLNCPLWEEEEEDAGTDNTQTKGE